jgi:hypothetical protein
VTEQTNTASWPERLGDRLNALAESEAPGATVTVDSVIASGRRRLRRRAHALALAAALVGVIALAAGVLAIAGPGHDSGGAVPATSHSGTPNPAPTDPLSPSIAFGWLPTSLNGLYEAEKSASGPNYNEPVSPTTDAPADNGPGLSTLRVWSTGVDFLTASATEPGSGMASGNGKIAAGDVQGHQAWWTSGAPSSAKAAPVGNLVVQWQYEPNAWASVSYHGQSDAAAGAMVLKVADSLKIGPLHPVALPFSLSTIPAGMHVDATLVNLSQPHGAKQGTASLRICAASPCSPDTGGLVIVQQGASFSGNSMLAVFDAPLPDVQEPDGQLSQGTAVNVNGHSAEVWTNSKGATLTFVYEGASVTISAADTEYKDLGGLNGFLAFCRSLSWYGASPSHWTTDVLR